MMLLFRCNMSLKSKIIIPFLLIVTMMGVVSVLMAIHVISQHERRQAALWLDQQQAQAIRSIDSQLRQVLINVQLIADFKKQVDAVTQPDLYRNMRAIARSLAEQDGTNIYWYLDDLSRDQKRQYQTLIQAGYKGQQSMAVFMVNTGPSIAQQQLKIVAVSPVKKRRSILSGYCGV